MKGSTNATHQVATRSAKTKRSTSSEGHTRVPKAVSLSAARLRVRRDAADRGAGKSSDHPDNAVVVRRRQTKAASPTVREASAKPVEGFEDIFRLANAPAKPKQIWHASTARPEYVRDEWTDKDKLRLASAVLIFIVGVLIGRGL
jgi:hypothetical protein